MKRLFVCLITYLLILALCIPVIASENVENIDSQHGLSVAYLEIDDNTTIIERTQILEARKAIIFSRSWVADGLSGCILDANGNIKEILPQFSEVFPADWELPKEENNLLSPPATLLKTGVQYDWNTFFNGSVSLSNPTNQNTAPFCTLNTTGFPGTYYEYRVTDVVTKGIRNNPTEYGKYNLGYSNATTGVSLGYAINLNNGEAFSINPPANIILGVRASSYDSIGPWNIRVDGKRFFSF